MFQQTTVVVKQFPDCTSPSACREFLREMDKFLFESYRPQLVFDLSQAAQMNAAGIDLLLRCIVDVADRDGYLKLAAPSPRTALILELTQLSGVVEVFDTVEAAMESFGIYQSGENRRSEQMPRVA